mmetsp:Transcript_3477/g.9691  ORF Transcript_3477/g.9691 Transcript_3477/m.9691 type:complete len:200 (-) Transcript_3477:70-669(-)
MQVPGPGLLSCARACVCVLQSCRTVRQFLAACSGRCTRRSSGGRTQATHACASACRSISGIVSRCSALQALLGPSSRRRTTPTCRTSPRAMRCWAAAPVVVATAAMRQLVRPRHARGVAASAAPAAPADSAAGIAPAALPGAEVWPPFPDAPEPAPAAAFGGGARARSRSAAEHLQDGIRTRACRPGARQASAREGKEA